MDKLINQVKTAGAIGSDEAIAAYLKELHYSSPVGEDEAQALAADFNKRQGKDKGSAIAPATQKVPSTQRALSGRGKGRSKKSSAIDAATVLISAEVEQARETVAQVEIVAEQLGAGVLLASQQAFDRMDTAVQLGLTELMEERRNASANFRGSVGGILQEFQSSLANSRSEDTALVQ